MRKAILTTLFIVIGLGIFFSASFLALAVRGDLRIDHYLFPLQTFSKNTYAKFIPRPEWLTSFLLDLTQRRLLDLALFAGTTYEIDAIQALDSTFQNSFEAYYSLDPDSSAQITSRVEEALEQIQNLSSILKLESNIPKSYDQLAAKLEIYRNLLSQNSSPEAAVSASLNAPTFFGATPVTPTPIVSVSIPALYGSGGLIPFFPGSPGWGHSFFPLLGSHNSLACSACHLGNSYSAASATCESCHGAVTPVNHFPLACEYCHTPEAWNSVNFLHTNQLPANCATCHASVKPSNHYNGTCSACHSTQSWLPADFNHQAAGGTDCQSCHTQNRPANHFAGQCSSCHSTSAWLPATFNHQAAGATDCQSCHLGVRPPNHFTSQCSSCHSTNAWQPANFNHTFPINHEGANGDCAKCHPSNPPAYNCFTCHERAELDQEHIEDEGIPDYVSRCMDCHPDGQEGDD